MAIQAKEVPFRAQSTVIGESILVNGKLEGDEDLTVRGRVHGSITLTKTLIVEPTGVVRANADVRNAVISGVVVGNISASESVHLTKDGRMVGDINAPRVIIVEGAAFRGRVDMGEVPEPMLSEHGSVPRPQSAPVTRPQLAPARPAVRPAPPPSRPVAPPLMSRPAARPTESRAPVLPPPPPLKASAGAAKGPAVTSAPLPAALGKKKVVVKRKK